MNGMYEMWDGYGASGWSDERTSEEKLDDLLKKGDNKPPQDSNRAFNYLKNNWELIHDYAKKYSFYYRYDAIMTLLKNYFGDFDKAPVRFFLSKKCIFPFIIYTMIYGVIATAFTSYMHTSHGEDVAGTVCIGLMSLYSLVYMLRDVPKK